MTASKGAGVTVAIAVTALTGVTATVVGVIVTIEGIATWPCTVLTWANVTTCAQVPWLVHWPMKAA